MRCSETDSAGAQCDRDVHEDDDHRIGSHSIAHTLAGDGYACSAIDPPGKCRTD